MHIWQPCPAPFQLSPRGQVSSVADPHTEKVEEEVHLPGKLGGLKAIAHQKVEHTGTAFP